MHLASFTSCARELSNHDFPGSQIRLILLSAISSGLRRRENGANHNRSDLYRFFLTGPHTSARSFVKQSPKHNNSHLARQRFAPRNHLTRQKRQFLNFFICPGAAAPIPCGWWQRVAFATFEPYNSGG